MLIRCDDHPSPERYSHQVDPVGYPDTAAICGRVLCTKPGRILLNDAEWKRYQGGQRIMEGPNNFTKIKAK
jgi:hypothetical protein